MKTDVYGTHVMRMHVLYLLKVSPLVCETNVTYPCFTGDTTGPREVLHLPRVMQLENGRCSIRTQLCPIRNLHSVYTIPSCPSTVMLWLEVVASSSPASLTIHLQKKFRKKIPVPGHCLFLGTTRGPGRWGFMWHPSTVPQCPIYSSHTASEQLSCFQLYRLDF